MQFLPPVCGCASARVFENATSRTACQNEHLISAKHKTHSLQLCDAIETRSVPSAGSNECERRPQIVANVCVLCVCLCVCVLAKRTVFCRRRVCAKLVGGGCHQFCTLSQDTLLLPIHAPMSHHQQHSEQRPHSALADSTTVVLSSRGRCETTSVRFGDSFIHYLGEIHRKLFAA